MTAAHRSDIVIAGGGPAGAMTALLLKRQRPELAILLLDALSVPRHRPCGEFLGPDGARVLAQAGLESAVIADGARILHGLSLRAGRAVLGADFVPGVGRAPPHPHGLGLRRETFDRRLQDAAEACGVELRRGVRLAAIERSGTGWRLDIAGRVCESPLLIGADGRHSLVRHRAGLDRSPARKRFALVCRAHGVAPPPGGMRHGEMHISPLGQVGLAPLDDREVNLNLLLSPAANALLKLRSPAALVRAALAGTASLRARCRDARLGPVLTTGSLPQGNSSVIADGVALVGDAAAFWDPFTGDGMSIALRSAETLARCLAAIDLRSGAPASELRAYALAWRRQLAVKRVTAPVLQHVLARRRLAEGLVTLLGRSRFLGRVMVATEGDRLLPR